MAGCGQQSTSQVSASEAPAEMAEGSMAAPNEVDIQPPAAMAAFYSQPTC